MYVQVPIHWRAGNQRERLQALSFPQPEEVSWRVRFLLDICTQLCGTDRAQGVCACGVTNMPHMHIGTVLPSLFNADLSKWGFSRAVSAHGLYLFTRLCMYLC